MEEVLKQLMNINCVSMHDSNYRCYGKGCNGQCAQFQVALDAIITKNCEWLETNTHNVNDDGVCLSFSNFKEAKQSITSL